MGSRSLFPPGSTNLATRDPVLGYSGQDKELPERGHGEDLGSDEEAAGAGLAVALPELIIPEKHQISAGFYEEKLAAGP